MHAISNMLEERSELTLELQVGFFPVIPFIFARRANRALSEQWSYTSTTNIGEHLQRTLLENLGMRAPKMGQEYIFFACIEQCLTEQAGPAINVSMVL